MSETKRILNELWLERQGRVLLLNPKARGLAYGLDRGSCDCLEQETVVILSARNHGRVLKDEHANQGG